MDICLGLDLTPPELRYFKRPEWTKGGPHEYEFWQFSNTK